MFRRQAGGFGVTGAKLLERIVFGVGRRLDATLKQLKAMLDAGLLVATPDPVDRRRMLYALAPSVPLTKTETGAVLDFGFCLLRL